MLKESRRVVGGLLLGQAGTGLVERTIRGIKVTISTVVVTVCLTSCLCRERRRKDVSCLSKVEIETTVDKRGQAQITPVAEGISQNATGIDIIFQVAERHVTTAEVQKAVGREVSQVR